MQLRVCFITKDNSIQCNKLQSSELTGGGRRATSLGFYSHSLCVDVHVTAAEVTWLPGTAGGEQAVQVVTYVGCHTQFAFLAAAGRYNATILVADNQQLQGWMQLSITRAENFTRGELDVSPPRGTEGSSFVLCLVAAGVGTGEYTGLIKSQGGNLLTSRRCLTLEVRGKLLLDLS